MAEYQPEMAPFEQFIRKKLEDGMITNKDVPVLQEKMATILQMNKALDVGDIMGMLKGAIMEVIQQNRMLSVNQGEFPVLANKDGRQPACGDIHQPLRGVHQARLCFLHRRSDFKGYGFQLREKPGLGEFIFDIQPNSPAYNSGLKEGDRIVEINGYNIINVDHQLVGERINSEPGIVCLLVVDIEADTYFATHRLPIHSRMPDLLVIDKQGDTSPVVDPKALRVVGNGLGTRKDQLWDLFPEAVAACIPWKYRSPEHANKLAVVYVIFNHEVHAREALFLFNGTFFNGQVLKLEFAPKDELQHVLKEEQKTDEALDRDWRYSGDQGQDAREPLSHIQSDPRDLAQWEFGYMRHSGSDSPHHPSQSRCDPRYPEPRDTDYRAHLGNFLLHHQSQSRPDARDPEAGSYSQQHPVEPSYMQDQPLDPPLTAAHRHSEEQPWIGEVDYQRDYNDNHHDEVPSREPHSGSPWNNNNTSQPVMSPCPDSRGQLDPGRDPPHVGNIVQADWLSCPPPWGALTNPQINPAFTETPHSNQDGFHIQAPKTERVQVPTKIALKVPRTMLHVRGCGLGQDDRFRLRLTGEYTIYMQAEYKRPEAKHKRVSAYIQFDTPEMALINKNFLNKEVPVFNKKPLDVGFATTDDPGYLKVIRELEGSSKNIKHPENRRNSSRRRDDPKSRHSSPRPKSSDQSHRRRSPRKSERPIRKRSPAHALHNPISRLRRRRIPSPLPPRAPRTTSPLRSRSRGRPRPRLGSRRTRRASMSLSPVSSRSITPDPSPQKRGVKRELPRQPRCEMDPKAVPSKRRHRTELEMEPINSSPERGFSDDEDDYWKNAQLEMENIDSSPERGFSDVEDDHEMEAINSSPDHGFSDAEDDSDKKADVTKSGNSKEDKDKRPQDPVGEEPALHTSGISRVLKKNNCPEGSIKESSLPARRLSDELEMEAINSSPEHGFSDEEDWVIKDDLDNSTCQDSEELAPSVPGDAGEEPAPGKSGLRSEKSNCLKVSVKDTPPPGSDIIGGSSNPIEINDASSLSPRCEAAEPDSGKTAQKSVHLRSRDSHRNHHRKSPQRPGQSRETSRQSTKVDFGEAARHAASLPLPKVDFGEAARQTSSLPPPKVDFGEAARHAASLPVDFGEAACRVRDNKRSRRDFLHGHSNDYYKFC